ncbi:16S rRNA (cytosine(967)-C(5))-methyltransferase RsmB [Lacticaseibacillus saniviri]|uniref:16S rRNA (cytosine(967)-C(5))-methyltransferase n=1 Tax=Lacticaseibacillus saniviri JCM 17471 = DSM 24301 TaxID=1293598 RepID=A0A0R2N273_9LACO|nr:16S rRNA (cytosine(967)-C(5))-methyltransferase RsmB [Lacticaseibacillus saniviri]KRO18587.1 tRNA and rRNA cytosine-C5-methytransferase [Lacticaseibacillus saniviri JCM 17471 = DSM 24301]
MKSNNPRDLAVTLLARVEQGDYSNLALDAMLKQHNLSGRDAALLTNIVYGVIQHRMTLDFDLEPFIGDKKLNLWVKVLLRTAVYQMVYLDKVPNRAIFFETTEIAKKRGHVGIAKLVTAVLRAIERKGIPDPETIADPIERLSIMSSTPTWIIEKLIDQLGETKTRLILDEINQPAHASLRVNTTQTIRDVLQHELAADFEDLAVSPLTPVGLIAPGGHLAGTPQFATGEYTMQDESSMLVAPSLDVQPSDQVLDACAAPGGKTTHIAEFIDPAQGGHVTALDLHPHKVKLIMQNAARLKLANRVSAQAMDARQVADTFAPDSFDKILVDAPCSGLGLIRRKPEIKYQKQPEDLGNLHNIQVAILDAVAPTLKIGGRLTYSTCTIVQEENQDTVEAFLATHPNFKQVTVNTLAPVTQAHNAPALQIYPDDYGTDGFFIACLERIE